MDSIAVVLTAPENLDLQRLALTDPGASDVVVDIAWSGISTGTERLLWSGRMPPFPGMGYPLVPGYESVGRVTAAGVESGLNEGETVFVPGANCFGPVRGLFGGAASRLVVPGARVTPIGDALGAEGVLLALAATAQHALVGGVLPELIIGHGVLGRVLARLVVLAGGAPTVWELNPARRGGAEGYTVTDPADHTRRDYTTICDVSGDPAILDTLITRLAPGGEVVLAGFYSEHLHFAFPPAFMREARIRVAAQWKPADLATVAALARSGELSLGGLLTHCEPASNAPSAYRTAFDDASCLKMLLDWKGLS